jgi:hypothetical protein
VHATARARLKEMLGFIEMMERFYTQMLAVPKPQIATAIKLGAKVLNFLPGRGRNRRKAPRMRRRKVESLRSQRPRRSAPRERAELGDLRFRALMSEADWLALPLSIRRRFSKRLAAATPRSMSASARDADEPCGWWLAQAARLIGGRCRSRATRMPERRDRHRGRRDARPALDAALRAPARLSAGRAFLEALRRPDRLEEYVGCGVGMALHSERMSEVDRFRRTCATLALIFRAAHYFLQLGRFRLRLPAGSARRARRHACRARRRALPVQARHHTPAARPADLPDRRLQEAHHDHAALDPDRDPDRDGGFRHDLSSRADRAARLAALAAP